MFRKRKNAKTDRPKFHEVVLNHPKLSKTVMERGKDIGVYNVWFIMISSNFKKKKK